MCNLLIIDSNERGAVNDMIRLIDRHFPNVILLPTVDSKKALQRTCLEQTVEIAVINADGEGDCFELYKELLSFCPNAKAILYSAVESFAIAQKALRYGLIDYLVEPITNDFVYALDRGIQSINQISLLHVEKNNEASPSLSLRHKILRYIHENYREHITLDTLADHLHLSRYHTSRLIKNTLGMTFSLYLMIYRIEVAKKELSTSDRSINEISVRVGFNDPNYFSKKFKKATSYTPKEYRKIYRGKATVIDSRLEF
ncbi:helix-turn-helix domain-containing protein [Enterococcus innesii]|nr:AraC family transcriptional regulator [Enterococcus innesii]MEB5919668.1 helix-turn-helix domain-containing protein [Enterococcus innesii]MEB5952329.1 helix-turn-helix domain-containing protein [Enterococcus innesii]